MKVKKHSGRAFNRYIIAHPELRKEAIEMKEAAAEPVLRNLRDLALSDDPEVEIRERISASKAYLDYLRKDRSETAVHIKHEHTHSVDPGTIQSISELTALVKERRRAIDVESVEITDELHPE